MLDLPAARRRRDRSGEASRSTSCTRTTSFIVINKPAGLVVHPAAGNQSGTLVNALIAHCGQFLSGIGGVRRPGIVHRLDKDTSGLMVVAKTDRAHRALSRQFADHGRSRPAAPRLSGVRMGRAGAPARHHRQADRTPSARARADGGARGRSRSSHPLGGAGTLSRQPTACRSRACSPAGSRPDAPTRFASTSPPSVTLSWATTSTAPGFKTKANAAPARPPAPRWKPLADRPCMPIYWLRTSRGGRDLEFRSELPDDLAAFTPQPRCAGHHPHESKRSQPINGLRPITRGSRRRDPGVPSFAWVCPVCCSCDRTSRSQHGSHRRLGERRWIPPAGQPGAN